jgi:signal transduction histidine kinase
MQNQLNEKAMKLNYTNTCKNTMHSTDIDKFNLILIHIISNAIKYSKISIGTININLYEDLNYYKIDIIDNGCGVDEDIITLFNDASKYKGLGVGLSVIKNAIKLLNGNITIKNNDNKEGTTFIISLKKELNFE